MTDLLPNLTTSSPISYSNYTIPDDDDYLPPLTTTQWVIIVFNLVVIVTSVVCNSTVIATILYNRHLRTRANYFMISQSIADVLFAMIVILGMILQALLGYWPFTPFWCAIYNACGIGLVMVSILNFCAITIDRYIAICHPFFQHRFNVNIHFLLAGIYIWVQPIILSLIPMMVWHDYTILEPNQCGHVITDTAEKIYFLVLIIINIFLPGIILSILYAIVFKTACSHVQKIKQQNSIHCSKERSDSGRKPITYQDIKLLLVFVFIIGIFYVTWAPFFVSLFITYFDDSIYLPEKEGLRQFFTVATMMSFTHCAINPIAYNFLNADMRRGLWNLLGISKRRRRASLRLSLQPTYSKTSRVSRHSKRGSNGHRHNSNSQLLSPKMTDEKRLHNIFIEDRLASLSSPLQPSTTNELNSVAITTV